MKPFKLRRGEFCPVHKSYFCCGRQTPRKVRPPFRFQYEKQLSRLRWEQIGHGIWRIPDPHHPRGFRERRNAVAMKTLLNQKILEQSNLCALCGKEFDDYSHIVAEHKEPKGMGSARRDDHPDNIQAAHSYPCNFSKGSKRIA